MQAKPALSMLERVSTLTEALPYLQRFRGKTIVIKYGGAAMKDPTLKVGIRCYAVDNLHCNVCVLVSTTLADVLILRSFHTIN